MEGKKKQTEEKRTVDTHKAVTTAPQKSPFSPSRRKTVVDTIDGAMACANVAHFMSEICMYINIYR